MTDTTPWRLLLCDDDPDMLRLMAGHFSHLGHEVHQATNGRECLTTWDAVRPDVTVLDIDMPEMTGMQALPELRRRGASVIMLTGRSQIELALSALKEGAENYLVKPTEMTHLEVMVRRAVDRIRQR